MSFILKFSFALSALFTFVFSIIGWRAATEDLPSDIAWIAMDVIPVVFGLAVIVLPYYINPPKGFLEWIKKDREVR